MSKAHLKNIFHLNVHVEQILKGAIPFIWDCMRSAVMRKPATWGL